MKSSRWVRLGLVASIVWLCAGGYAPAAEVVYCSGGGNDASGDGSPANPYRSITRALTNLPAPMVVYVCDGTYSTNDGEVFPLVLPGGTQLIGTNEVSNALIDASYVTNIFLLPTSSSNNLIRNLDLKRARGTAMVAGGWNGTLDNCLITDIANGGARGQTAGLYSYGTGVYNLTLSGVKITNVTTSVERILSCYSAGGTLLITNCLFYKLTTGATAQRGTFHSENPLNVNSAAFTVTMVDTTFDTLTGSGGSRESGIINPWGPTAFVMDRCIIRNVSDTRPVIDPNRMSSSVIRNCVIYNTQCGSWPAIGCFRTYTEVRNCTLDSVSTAFGNADGNTTGYYVYNSIVSYSASLTGVAAFSPRLLNVNIYQTPLGSGYDLNYSDTITGVDPWYVDRQGSNFHLRTLSPLVDRGDNTRGPGVIDLDRATRLQDGDADGTATVDLGAYEVNFLSPTNARFATARPTYAVFGGSRSVPVFINPPVGGAVEARVLYGTNVAGGGVLSWGSGGTTGALDYTVSQPLSVSNGTLTSIRLVETNTSCGVEAGDIGLYVYDGVVTINSATQQVLRAGLTNTVRVQLVNPQLQAPGAITVTVGSTDGTGSNQISWQGDGGITNGGWQTGGELRLIGGSGRNTVTLTVDNGFVFAENGLSSLLLTVVGMPNPGYVANTGSDSSGEGTAENPFKTITYAVAQMTAGEELRLFPGVYSVSSGETFPIQPAGVGLVGYDPAGSGSPTNHTIDGRGAAVNLMKYFQTASVTGYLANITLSNATQTLVYIDQGRVVMTNCVIRDTTCNGIAVGASLRNDSLLTVQKCEFRNLSGKGAIGEEVASANNGNTIWATDCVFADNYSTYGTVYSAGSVAGRFYLTQCLFQSNDVQNVVIQDAYAASGVYLFGGSGLPHILVVDRCRFLDNTNGVLFAASSIPGLVVKNSLIVNNKCNWDLFHGYGWGGSIVNCTFVKNKGVVSGRQPSHYVYLRNSIVSSNDTPIGGGVGAYLIIQTSLVWQAELGLYATGSSSGIITNVDPRLRDGFVLGASSPAVDVGHNVFMADLYDLAGRPRVFHQIVDLGAYECSDLPGTVLIVE